jgi:two-component system, OmpR family, response regulator MprA
VRPVSAEEHVAVVPVAVAPRIDLLGRLRSFLRRREVAGANRLRFGDLTLDPDSREVRRGRRTIELTPIEFSLLELFLQHPGSVLTRSSIFAEVWGFDFGVMSNSLNVYVGNVRRKTEAAGEPRLIHTIRGVGYVLRER